MHINTNPYLNYEVIETEPNNSEPMVPAWLGKCLDDI